MKIPKEISEMVSGGWCKDCKEHLQKCIAKGKCIGNDDGGEKDVKDTV